MGLVVERRRCKGEELIVELFWYINCLLSLSLLRLSILSLTCISQSESLQSGITFSRLKRVFTSS